MAKARHYPPQHIYLGAADADGEHPVWFDHDEGGTQYVRADLAAASSFDLLAELKRMVDHFGTWANDHADEATCETWAALHCARELISKAEGSSNG